MHILPRHAHQWSREDAGNLPQHPLQLAVHVSSLPPSLPVFLPGPETQSINTKTALGPSLPHPYLSDGKIRLKVGGGPQLKSHREMRTWLELDSPALGAQSQ
jgi:hypothetical protein